MNLLCMRLTKSSGRHGIAWICHKRYHSCKSPHKVLKIREGASKEEIKSAFLELSKQYHPDKNKNDPKAHEKFVELNNAYQALMDAHNGRGNTKYGPRTSYTQNWDPTNRKWEFDRKAYERRKQWQRHEYEREKFRNQEEVGQQLFHSINISFMVFFIILLFHLYLDYFINKEKNREAARKRKLELEKQRKYTEALSELKKIKEELNRKKEQEKLRKAEHKKQEEMNIKDIIFKNRETDLK